MSRPRLTLTQDTLVIRHLLSTQVLPLRDIVAVTPQMQGLVITTTGGDSVSGPDLIGEKSLLSDWLGLHTRADRLATTILSARPPH